MIILDSLLFKLDQKSNGKRFTKPQVNDRSTTGLRSVMWRIKHSSETYFNLAASGFMNFHPCHRLQDFLYVLLTLRKAIIGISQLQYILSLLLEEGKSINILISFSDFSFPNPLFPLAHSPLLLMAYFLGWRESKSIQEHKHMRCP